jgi:ribose-phosphate pyrophosphokinase
MDEQTPTLIFAGSSHPNLVRELCACQEMRQGALHLGKFPDGETQVRIMENVEGRDLFILQSIAKQPNDYLLELCVIADALRRASAKQITAIIPYLGYCRQDRQDQSGVPITAKLVANLLTTAGITRLITFDLHALQIAGFYEIPIKDLRCQQALYQEYRKVQEAPCVIVAPDTGSIKIAESMARYTGADLAVLKKARLDPAGIELSLIGDVKNREVLIVDDLCSTGTTIAAAANLCHNKGAARIVAAVTHTLFSRATIDKITACPCDLFLTTNTIEPLPSLPKSVKLFSVADLIHNEIRNLT